ncbi:hypothetical protein [Jiangella gansuensis]|uniref:hypothetical protein n=1 Tax=Jiangella gansuensis TaxID=281473 RepID=UPI0004AF17A3|nr:hypothetical protein [Jiangella gansuensis]
MSRPRVAVIATTYFAGSHADVCVTRLIEGYDYRGQHIPARVEVASLYLEQLGDSQEDQPRPDIGVAIAARNGVPLYPTVAEAIGCGRPGVGVDGVVIIGEHGDYEHNERGQKLYPRRRLFDSAVATMIGAGRTVPIFNDKHLAWSFNDAKAMYDTARRLGIALLAGSTVPLTWRTPRGTVWPAGEPMSAALVVGYGPTERYGFHILEGLQAHTERRRGGESGVAAVTALSGAAAVRATRDGVVPHELLHDALRHADVSDADFGVVADDVQDVFVVEYVDGLFGFGVNFVSSVRTFAAAAHGPRHRMACTMQLQDAPYGHFVFLVRQIENLVLTGQPTYPVERTLLTTGVLDAAMRSRHDGGTRRVTPELSVVYEPVLDVPDTGIELAFPLSPPEEL